MPDEIKNEEGVDFSHVYDTSSVEIQKDLAMARVAQTQKNTKKQKTRLIVASAIVGVLAVAEIVLLVIGSQGKPSTTNPKVPAGYVPATSPNGMPYFKFQKK